MILAERLEANAILDRLVADGPTFSVSDARHLIALIASTRYVPWKTPHGDGPAA